MTYVANCSFGMFKRSVNALSPPMPLRLGGMPVEEYFSRASLKADGTPAIGMRALPSYAQSAAMPEGAPGDLLWLNSSLSRIASNDVSLGRANNIGVVFADYFAPRPTLFGLMFDLGFTPDGQANLPNQFDALPREGCAIFLSAIARLRTAETFAQEVLFTVVHELGHVFNLWHDSGTPPTFMTTSRRDAPFGVPAYWFRPEHETYLSQCETLRFVYPGGSRWGERGDFGPREGFPFDLPKHASLKLKIGISEKEFWPFDPVELDFTLRHDTQDRKTLTLPDVLDPGYPQFVLWITGPDGSRRRYRAPVQYCCNHATLTISAGKPFRRDIPIFGQSGGYTFRDAGRHEICATLIAPDGRLVQSNKIDVYVKPGRLRSSEYQKAFGALRNVHIARALFYKSTTSPLRIERALKDTVKYASNKSVRSTVQYSVAVAFLRTLKLGTRVHRERRSRWVRDLLQAALDSGNLGSHRERRARQHFDAMS